MRVDQVMRRPVATCGPDDSLETAARIMWERDCGCVPVVGASNGSGQRLLGIVTDRDACMAAYTQGRTLREIQVGTVMSRDVCSARPSDSLATVMRIMEENQVHRVPVVDEDECITGIISLADIAREAVREQPRGGRREVTEARVGKVVEAIVSPRDTHVDLTAV